MHSIVHCKLLLISFEFSSIISPDFSISIFLGGWGGGELIDCERLLGLCPLSNAHIDFFSIFSVQLLLLLLFLLKE